MTQLSKSDSSWLLARYPRLVVVELRTMTVVKGVFDFACSHNARTITDAYSIRLELPKDPTQKPTLEEVGGRLKRVLAAHPELKNRELDLHLYTSGKSCIMTPQEWELDYLPNPDIKRLFTKYIEPYFYSQSYFERHSAWPWPHYGHNTTGLVQWYIENWQIDNAASMTASEISKLIGRDDEADVMAEMAVDQKRFSFWDLCLCGSGKKYLVCHPALAKLADELRKTAQ